MLRKIGEDKPVDGIPDAKNGPRGNQECGSGATEDCGTGRGKGSDEHRQTRGNGRDRNDGEDVDRPPERVQRLCQLLVPSAGKVAMQTTQEQPADGACQEQTPAEPVRIGTYGRCGRFHKGLLPDASEAVTNR
jgi:hypothetical protein